MNGVPVFWQSSMLPFAALGSAEAEIYALAEAAKPARLLLRRAEGAGLQTQRPAVIQVDSRAGISSQKATDPNTRLPGAFGLGGQCVGELRNSGDIRTAHAST